MQFLKEELIAILKDLFAGMLVLAIIIIVYTVTAIPLDFFSHVFGFVSENFFIQIAVGIGSTILIGIGTRKLPMFKKFKWLDRVVPTKALKKPEIRIPTKDPQVFDLRIELRKTNDFIETGIASGSLISYTILQDKVIYTKDPELQGITYTGRTAGDVLRSMATIGIATGEKSKTD